MSEPPNPRPGAPVDAPPAEPADLPDLACARLGGAVLAANDEFFAPKENLVRDEPARWDPDRYTDRGKWMDGWETRRRREPGHDWCVVRLGLPGIPRVVVVDTAHFRGNFPESCSLEGCDAPAEATAEELLGPGVEWLEILPVSRLEGDARNRFALETPYRFTHLRLHIYPDGGVARLRVHGEVVPRAADLAGDAPVDLAALAHGARVVAASDRFFGSPEKLLLPGDPAGMHDGWETRRRRGPGHDWVVIRLAAPGVPERVEVDTSFFKGNAPGSCSLEGLLAGDGPPGLAAGFDSSSERGIAAPPGSDGELDLAAAETAWRPLLPRTALEPDRVHLFDRLEPIGGPVTHVRFAIHPDGGVARLRVHGRLDPAARERLALGELDALPPAAARRRLLDCCGSPRWAQAMAARRPFAGRAALLAAAEEEAGDLDRDDWLAAFAAHPPIGGAAADAERPRGERSARWSEAEQAGARGDAALAARLAEANRRHRERFGHVFIVCAAGKSGEEMLALLEERLGHDPDRELRVAAAEERKIMGLRLGKLLGGSR
jgi:allantoicase